MKNMSLLSLIDHSPVMIIYINTFILKFMDHVLTKFKGLSMKKTFLRRIVLFVLFILTFTLSVCKKEEPTPPIITTIAVTAITQTTAASGGNVTSDGGTSVTARGVCWSTTTGPTTALSTKTIDGTGTGTLTSSITGLTAGITYYVRAYAANSAGTSYGNEISFTTTASTVPVLTTTAASAITQTTATSGGNITSDGGASVTARGVCWSTTTGPTTTLSTKTTDDTGTGTFTSSITGLIAGTVYYVRAYATNSAGTAYGNEINYTTLATVPGAPTIGTATAGNSQSTVTFTAPVSNGGSAITGYTVTSSPGSISGTGSASPITVTGLSNGTAYTFTVTATNAIGTSVASSASNSVTPTGSGSWITVFSDDFSNNLANWTNPTGQGSWSLSAGKLMGNYDITCGSTTCPQADLILNDQYQVSDNWKATTSFTKFLLYNYGGNAYGTYATFSLWTSSSNKIAISVGEWGVGFQGGTQDSLYVMGSKWNGSWSGLPIPGASKTGRFKYPGGTWNANGLNTATIQKNGTIYKVYFNDLLIAQFDGSFLSGTVKIGYHTYGATEQESFQLLKL
jgi:hypothetical protein